jgi:hypothetical protein
LIDFPIEGLDLKPHVIVHEDSMIYDLYGVVNHSGTLNSGHYVSHCFNHARQKWFYYNDTMVSELKGDPQQEIVTNNAYVLFYRKRGFNPHTKEDFESIKVTCSKSDALIQKREIMPSEFQKQAVESILLKSKQEDTMEKTYNISSTNEDEQIYSYTKLTALDHC